MRESSTPRPTNAELEILRIVWDLQPCTVGQIHERIAQARRTNYSTTMKMLSLMLGKGLLTRDETVSPHRYRAKFTRQRARTSLLSDLIDSVYEGSAMSVALQALGQSRAAPEEIAAARAMLDELERRRQT
ncbi:MAG: BlaI/MecI/CopY family transcriptional regulator [Planctomycetaceae bacterium]|nr:BlaI/MecI/CopY family transcriptional regulator [Planctomycetaceae bacterium]